MSRTGTRRILITADAVGGVWQYATDLAHALSTNGDEVLLAVMGPPPDDEQRRATRAAHGVTLIETGVELDWLASGPKAVASSGRLLAELAADVAATVVHLNAPALAASARFRMPLVAVTHSCMATWWQAVEGGRLPADLAWHAAVTEQGLKAANHVVAPSAAFAEATMRTYRLATPPSVVHNGRGGRAASTAALHDFAFTAGRLWDKGKDLATLDRAAARLAIPFKAAGAVRGPNGDAIEFRDIIPVGRLGDDALADQLAARPVFVSASRYEPFGLAVLEAAAAGCALVVSDIPTFRELWDGAAVFVAPGDDRGFAEAIETVVGDTGLRSMLGAAARERAARFTPAAMADGMAAIYRSLLAVGSRAAA